VSYRYSVVSGRAVSANAERHGEHAAEPQPTKLAWRLSLEYGHGVILALE
jgi:hypothetical protein